MNKVYAISLLSRTAILNSHAANQALISSHIQL